jgi:hypothetical protein
VEQRFEVGGLLFKKRPNMDAWRRTGTPERDNVRNFGERQPEPTRPSDEGEHVQGVGRVEPIARGRPIWWGENLSRLVEPQRFATDPGLG